MTETFSDVSQFDFFAYFYAISNFYFLLNRSVTHPALKITAGHWTMSGQDDYLSGQNLGLAVILTGQVRGFQIIHQNFFFLYFRKI